MFRHDAHTLSLKQLFLKVWSCDILIYLEQMENILFFVTVFLTDWFNGYQKGFYMNKMG